MKDYKTYKLLIRADSESRLSDSTAKHKRNLLTSSSFMLVLSLLLGNAQFSTIFGFKLIDSHVDVKTLVCLLMLITIYEFAMFFNGQREDKHRQGALDDKKPSIIEIKNYESAPCAVDRMVTSSVLISKIERACKVIEEKHLQTSESSEIILLKESIDKLEIHLRYADENYQENRKRCDELIKLLNENSSKRGSVINETFDVYFPLAFAVAALLYNARYLGII